MRTIESMDSNNRLVAAINVSIIVTAVLLGVVCVKKYLLTYITTTATKPAALAPIAVGTNISIPNVVWSRSRKTMIVALHEGCRFCTESAPFYKRLIAKANANKNLQLIAVLPQDPINAGLYLDSLGVAFSDIKYLELRKIGVRSTPTLLLLDDHGVITAFWVGALSVDQENEVLRRIEEIA